MSEIAMNLKKYAPAVLAAAVAGPAVSVLAAGTPDAYAGGSTQDHVTGCMAEYAQLQSHNGLSANIINARKVGIGIHALNMHVKDPSCNDADVSRRTNVTVYQNGRRIAFVRNMLNPSNDHGEQIVRDVRTSRRIGCNAVEKVVYTTAANSPLAPAGTESVGNQHLSFRTHC